MLDEELENPDEFAYEGGNLEVVLPSAETFAETKSPDSDKSDKYLEQFEIVDRILGTDLAKDSDF
ncbi:MAG: hypothetical protein ABEJ36_06445 [Candidatus Nanosalina sp.]